MSADPKKYFFGHNSKSIRYIENFNVSKFVTDQGISYNPESEMSKFKFFKKERNAVDVFSPKHHDLYKRKGSSHRFLCNTLQKILKEAKIDVGEIVINSIPDVPIWDCVPVTVDLLFPNLTSHLLPPLFNELKQKYFFGICTLTGVKLKQK